MELQRYNGDFAQCLEQIAKAGQKIATARKGIQERIRQGANADICAKGSWFPENWNSVRGKILLALQDYNPIIPYAQQAVDANKKGVEFYLTDDILLYGKPATQVLREIAEEDAPKQVHERRVLICKNKKQETGVSTRAFGEEEEIIFLARGERLAKEYGDFLREFGIETTLIYRPPTIVGKDLARGFWLYWLGAGGESVFDGNGRGLGLGSGSLFGVYKKSAEGISQKILPYTQRDAKKYLNILSRVMNGELGTSRLKELVKFFRQK